MSNNKIKDRWKELSSEFNERAKKSRPVSPILKEAAKIEKSAKFLGLKLQSNKMAKAVQVMKEYVYKVGIHTHRLERENNKTLHDGAHSHLFVLPNGDAVITEHDGAHTHEIGHVTGDLITETGTHSHRIEISENNIVKTSHEESIHDHQLILDRSCEDGIHIHNITLIDGSKIYSMWAGEFWDFLGESPQTLDGFDVGEKLSLGKESIEKEFSKIKRLQDSSLTITASMENLRFNTNLSELNNWIEVRLPVGVHPMLSKQRVLVEKRGDKIAVLRNGRQDDELDFFVLAEKIQLQELDIDFSIEGYLVNDEKSARIFLVDILHDDSDLTTTTFKRRRDILESLFSQKFVSLEKFALLDVKWIGNISETQDTMTWALANDKTIGALVKSEQGLYPINSSSTDWFKVNKEEKSLSSETIMKENIDDATQLALAALGVSVQESQQKEPVSKEREIVSKDHENLQVQICKESIDHEKRYVLGVVIEPMFKDNENDIMTHEEVEKTAHDFLANQRVTGYRHKDRMNNVDIVESYLAPVDFELNGELVKKGSWLLGTIIHDDVLWNQVKGFLINGYSPGGFAYREDI